MMHITSDGSTDHLRWAARYFDDQWGVGFVEDDDPATLLYAGNGCGPCTIFGNGRQVELAVPPGATELTLKNLLITVEVQDFADPENPITISTVGGGDPIAV